MRWKHGHQISISIPSFFSGWVFFFFQWSCVHFLLFPWTLELPKTPDLDLSVGNLSSHHCCTSPCDALTLFTSVGYVRWQPPLHSSSMNAWKPCNAVGLPFYIYSAPGSGPSLCGCSRRPLFYDSPPLPPSAPLLLPRPDVTLCARGCFSLAVRLLQWALLLSLPKIRFIWNPLIQIGVKGCPRQIASLGSLDAGRGLRPKHSQENSCFPFKAKLNYFAIDFGTFVMSC